MTNGAQFDQTCKVLVGNIAHAEPYIQNLLGMSKERYRQDPDRSKVLQRAECHWNLFSISLVHLKEELATISYVIANRDEEETVVKEETLGNQRVEDQGPPWRSSRRGEERIGDYDRSAWRSGTGRPSYGSYKRLRSWIGAASWSASAWMTHGQSKVGLCHPIPSRIYPTAESEEKRDTILVLSIVIVVLLTFQCFVSGRRVGLWRTGRPEISIQCDRPSAKRQDIDCLMIDAIRDELKGVYKMKRQPTPTKGEVVELLCALRAADTLR